MPSFQDSIFLFILALLLFGPKRLPVLARELGKWVGEFRRASNEFKMQMEEELRLAEQADRQKQIAAMEAAAPVAPAIAEPGPSSSETNPEDSSLAATTTEASEVMRPLPIATSGELNIMPPSTGLPVPQSKSSSTGNEALEGLMESIPVAAESPSATENPAEKPTAETVSPEMLEYARESATHGD